MSYTGASVSAEFTQRWRSKQHVAGSKPYGEVWVRRGSFQRTYSTDWPDPQFGQLIGHSIRDQWYPTWYPDFDPDTGQSVPWVQLDGVSKIDLKQTFDANGSTVATIDVDNVEWADALGADDMLYHTRQRGYLWPWRGWVPPRRPGSGETKDQWYNQLPNAQILVKQGYGSDTAVKTFTGLIDTLAPTVRPDSMTITARDFGGVLTDSFLFGWNKDPRLQDPFHFIPPDYKKLDLLHVTRAHRYIIVADVCDIVRCALRWCGFKEWEIEDSGVTLSTTYVVDKTKAWTDVITDVATQLGYVFFIGEPSDDDLSIGVPIFRPAAYMSPSTARPITIRDSDLLTDLKPTHDNTDDRYIIRVRGSDGTAKQGATLLAGDSSSTLRFMFTYWTPWMPRMAGVIKQLTYYNIGTNAVLGFTSIQQCMVAAILIAYQIALARDAATAQCPGNPAMGLDSFIYIIDTGTGVTSRLYITDRQSTMELGGDGTSLATSGYQSGGGQASDELRWGTELGGALVDNPEWEHLVSDYETAKHGGTVESWGTSY